MYFHYCKLSQVDPGLVDFRHTALPALSYSHTPEASYRSSPTTKKLSEKRSLGIAITTEQKKIKDISLIPSLVPPLFGDKLCCNGRGPGSGGQKEKGKGLRVYLCQPELVWTGVYIWDMIQYRQFIVSCEHTNTVLAVKTLEVSCLAHGGIRCMVLTCKCMCTLIDL